MSYKQIQYYRNLIEASVYLEPDCQSIITQWFPKLSMNIRDKFQSLVNMDVEKRILQNSKSFLTILNKYQYADIAPVTVPVPAGLDTTYTELLSALIIGSQFVKDVEKRTIDPYNDLLSNLINNKSVRYNTGSIDKSFLVTSKHLEGLSDKIESCFGTTDNTYVPYEKAIKRNSDWQQVFKSVEDIQTLGGINLSRIEKKSNVSITYLDQIIALAKENDFKNTNPDLVKHIAFITEVAAKEIGFISTMAYHTKATFEAINSLIKELIDKLD